MKFKTIKNIALPILFLSSVSSSYANDDSIGSKVRELSHINKELKVLDQSKTNEILTLSKHAYSLVRDIKKSEEFNTKFRAVESVIKIYKNLNYNRFSKEKASKLIMDKYDMNNYIYSHKFAKHFSDSSSVIYNTELSDKILIECSKAGSEACIEKRLSENIGDQHISSASDLMKTRIKNKINAIFRKKNPTMKDVDFLLNSYGMGFHSNHVNIENILMGLSYDQNEAAINRLATMYEEKIIFDVTEEKIMLMKYLKLSLGSDKLSKADLSRLVSAEFEHLGDRGAEIKRRFDKEMTK